MRCLLFLFSLVFLTGCPSKPSPSSKATPEATPQPSPQKAPPKQSRADFEGVWNVADSQGQNFDIMIFPNGQVVTNFGTSALGLRGFWKILDHRFIGLFQGGTLQILEKGTRGMRFRTSSNETGTEKTTSPATRVDKAMAPFVGIWRMNKEPDGSYLYLSLHSNGQALSTVNGGTVGRWELTPKGALCHWPDGWVDLIERIPGGWQKRSWVGAESEAPADISHATRVGEEKFGITP